MSLSWLEPLQAWTLRGPPQRYRLLSYRVQRNSHPQASEIHLQGVVGLAGIRGCSMACQNGWSMYCSDRKSLKENTKMFICDCA